MLAKKDGKGQVSVHTERLKRGQVQQCCSVPLLHALSAELAVRP